MIRNNKGFTAPELIVAAGGVFVLLGCSLVVACGAKFLWTYLFS